MPLLKFSIFSYLEKGSWCSHVLTTFFKFDLQAVLAQIALLSLATTCNSACKGSGAARLFAT